mmetsp:Transcript_18489/g.30183  ORF Transcript_18489/g.30183 Transcript_18489/m.30183 type:complete len:231 (+) Transcript_18489:3070-3762(+)
MRPARLAASGALSLPSSRKGEAPIAPSIRVRRVVPPAPGKMPTRISGRPRRALGLLATKVRCVARGSSRPMPTAVPGMAEAIGLPPFWVLGSMPASSILRSRPCIFMVPSKRPLAASSPALSFILASRFRSIPPAKVSLPEVITMPLTASSPKASSTRSFSSSSPSKDMTFMDLSATSQVMVATPSASLVMVKSVIGDLPSSECLVSCLVECLRCRRGSGPTSSSARSRA